MWSAMAALLDNTTVRADGSSAEASVPQASPDDAAAWGAFAEAVPEQQPLAAPNAAAAPHADAMSEQTAAPLAPENTAAPSAQTPTQGGDPSRWAPPSLLPPGSGPVAPIAPTAPAAPPAAAPPPADKAGQPGTDDAGVQLLPAPDDALFAEPSPQAVQPAASWPPEPLSPQTQPAYPPAPTQAPFVLREVGSPFTMPAGLDQNAVTLRGRSDGIAIDIASGKWEDLLQLLSYRLEQTDGFFSGGFVAVDVGTRQTNEAELDLLARVLGSYSLQAGVVRTSAERTFQAALALGLPCAQIALDGTVVNEAMPAQADDNTFPFFVYRGSLRSGQQLYRPEHIMIMGDVNPGAEVASNGDILVWGRLRGVAHAGAQGNMGAIIAALDLDPVQLRIHTVVAAAQAGQSEGGGPRWGGARSADRRPEVARLANGRLLIEAWDDVKTAGAPILKRRRA